LRAFVYDQWNAFHTKPRFAQLAGFAIGTELDEFLFNYGCGVGKTKQILDLIRFHRFRSAANRWLVLVPNVINIQSWEDQIEEHAPDLTFQPLVGSREVRHQLVNERVNIQILNYAGLQSYMTELEHGEGRKVNKSAARDFAGLFDGVVFDELHNIGNKQTLTYRLCRRLSRVCGFRYGATATLFGRDPTMMWTQYDLVDHGHTLGETLGLYRAAFFEAKDDLYRGIRFEFDRSKSLKLSRFIRHRSLRFTAEECGDIPAVNHVPERLTWGDEQLAFYNRLRGECKVLGKKVRLNPHTYTRMRQICSGYVGYSTEDDGKAKLVFEQNPKLERLLQIIDEMPIDTKIMVMHQYIYTGELICDALEKRKIRVAKLFGKVKDGAKQWRLFLEDPRYRVISAQYSRVAGGNPHKVASYMYFFESPPDPITRTQVEERLDRPGQPRKVFIYDPIMPNSFEEALHESLAEGIDFSEKVQSGKALA
jgi:superfamily II DNA or RNA helicase